MLKTNIYRYSLNGYRIEWILSLTVIAVTGIELGVSSDMKKATMLTRIGDDDRQKHTVMLTLRIITGLLMLLWVYKTTIIERNAFVAVKQCVLCGLGLLYSEARWTITFLKKHPDRHWRQIPRFIKGEAVLNTYAFGFYKWVFLIATIIVLL